MKIFLLFFCLINTVTVLSAQDTPPPPEERPDRKPHQHRHFPIHFELGANVLQIARVAKENTADSTGLNLWVFDGRLSYRQLGIRGSFGGSYRSTQKFIAGFRDSETHTISALNYRAGISYRKSFNRRFSADFGLDWAVFDFMDEKITDSGFDIIERIYQSKLKGGGLSIGTSWWMTKRLGIKLELSYYYLTGEQKQARRFVNFPELDDQIDHSDITEVRLPVGLFITYRL